MILPSSSAANALDRARLVRKSRPKEERRREVEREDTAVVNEVEGEAKEVEEEKLREVSVVVLAGSKGVGLEGGADEVTEGRGDEMGMGGECCDCFGVVETRGEVLKVKEGRRVAGKPTVAVEG